MDELGSVGVTTDSFLSSAALYRFVCRTKPFERVRIGPGPLIDPIVAQYTNAAAGLRLCYALGEAVYTLGQGVGSYRQFERYVYSHSYEILEQGAAMTADHIAGHFQLIFSRRLGFIAGRS